MERTLTPGHLSRISEPTLRRLPGYYRYFRDLQTSGAQLVSCAMVGRDLSIDPTLVRKDLESIAAVGRRRVGFVLSDLVRGIETSLGYNGLNRAFLMGAGNLGTALLGYKKFREYGLQIVAVFDAAPSSVGERLHDLEVQPLERLPELAREWNPQIGIVTVPVAHAQQAVNLLVENGIRAIWNFAPVRVQVPPDVIVQSEDSLPFARHVVLQAGHEAAGRPPELAPLVAPALRSAASGTGVDASLDIYTYMAQTMTNVIAKIRHAELARWVEEVALQCRPDRIQLCDGSKREYRPDGPPHGAAGQRHSTEFREEAE